MRTTLDLPEDLVLEAMRSLQFKSKTDTVVHALRELLRRRRLEELKGLRASFSAALGQALQALTPRVFCGAFFG